MTVYIEYAFLENFLLDGALLWLSLIATRTSVKPILLLVAAGLGGVFAVVFPLLSLSVWLGSILKFAVGFFLCMVAFGKICNKKQWGRYALTVAFFFTFTFSFGGALLSAVHSFSLSRLPNVAVWVGFIFLSVAALLFIAKMYKRRAVERQIYPCIVLLGEKKAQVRGFWDSGNLAKKNGLPVCFLSADILYNLCGQDIIFGGRERGQSRDEMTISTMSGERKVPLYKGKLQVITDGKNSVEQEVYFALSTNMISREYKLILQADVEGIAGR